MESVDGLVLSSFHFLRGSICLSQLFVLGSGFFLSVSRGSLVFFSFAGTGEQVNWGWEWENCFTVAFSLFFRGVFFCVFESLIAFFDRLPFRFFGLGIQKGFFFFFFCCLPVHFRRQRCFYFYLVGAWRSESLLALPFERSSMVFGERVCSIYSTHVRWPAMAGFIFIYSIAEGRVCVL
jgi:hypothetical protein